MSHLVALTHHLAQLFVLLTSWSVSSVELVNISRANHPMIVKRKIIVHCFVFITVMSSLHSNVQFEKYSSAVSTLNWHYLRNLTSRMWLIVCPCFASRQIKLLNTTCNVVSKNHKAKSKLSIICFRVVLDTKVTYKISLQRYNFAIFTYMM